MSWSHIRKARSENAILSRRNSTSIKASGSSISAAVPAGIQSNLQNAVYAVTGIDLSIPCWRSQGKSQGARTQYRLFKTRRAAIAVHLRIRRRPHALRRRISPYGIRPDELSYPRNAKNALKGSGSKLIFTTLNGLFPLFHSVKDFLTAEAKGGTTYGQNTFDLMTFRDYNVATVDDDSGTSKNYGAMNDITFPARSPGCSNASASAASISSAQKWGHSPQRQAHSRGF